MELLDKQLEDTIKLSKMIDDDLDNLVGNNKAIVNINTEDLYNTKNIISLKDTLGIFLSRLQMFRDQSKFIILDNPIDVDLHILPKLEKLSILVSSFVDSKIENLEHVGTGAKYILSVKEIINMNDSLLSFYLNAEGSDGVISKGNLLNDIAYKARQKEILTLKTTFDDVYNGLPRQYKDLFSNVYQQGRKTIDILLIKGGRGGAKTSVIVTMIVMLSFHETYTNTSFFIIRAFLNSIAESCKSTFVSKIEDMNLNKYFKITQSEIFNKLNNTKIVFKGLRNVDSLRGADNVALVWYEEGHEATSDQLAKSYPSFRGDKNNSDVTTIVSLNPQYTDDPIMLYFADYDNLTQTHVNIEDLPTDWQSPKVMKDLETSKKRNLKEYKLEFLGEPLGSSNLKPFRNIRQELTLENSYYREPPIMWIDPSYDGGDYTAVTVYGYLTRHNLLGVRGFAYKLSITNTLPYISKIIKQFHIEEIGFESNGGVKDIIEGYLYNNHDNILANGKATTTNKQNRISSIGVYSDNIVLIGDSDASLTYNSQIMGWHAKTKDYDDAPDSLACVMLNYPDIKNQLK